MFVHHDMKNVQTIKFGFLTCTIASKEVFC